MNDTYANTLPRHSWDNIQWPENLKRRDPENAHYGPENAIGFPTGETKFGSPENMLPNHTLDSTANKDDETTIDIDPYN